MDLGPLFWLRQGHLHLHRQDQQYGRDGKLPAGSCREVSRLWLCFEIHCWGRLGDWISLEMIGARHWKSFLVFSWICSKFASRIQQSLWCWLAIVHGVEGTGAGEVSGQPGSTWHWQFCRIRRRIDMGRNHSVPGWRMSCPAQLQHQVWNLE